MGKDIVFREITLTPSLEQDPAVSTRTACSTATSSQLMNEIVARCCRAPLRA